MTSPSEMGRGPQGWACESLAEHRRSALVSPHEPSEQLNPAEAERERLTALLTDVVLASYKDIPLPTGSQRLYKPWNPALAGDPFLFILVKKTDFEKLKPKIVALIHKIGESAQSFESTRRYEFAASQFHDGGKDSHGDEIVWAMHDMTGSSITQEMVDSTRLLEETKKKLALQLTDYTTNDNQAKITADKDAASTLNLKRIAGFLF